MHRALFAFLCIALLLTGLTALAESGQQKGSISVGTLQERLRDLGYYDGSMTFEFDMATQYALKKCCEANGLPFLDGQLLQVSYDAIVNSDDVKPKSAQLMEHKRLSIGDEGQSVIDMQLRLKELGYVKGVRLSLGHYDDETQRAIETFCEQNDLTIPDQGVDEYTQYMLYSDVALHYAAPVPPGFWGRVREFLSRPVRIGGMELNSGILVLIEAMLFIGLVVSALILMRSSKPRAPKEPERLSFSIDSGKTDAWSAVVAAVEYAGKKRTQVIQPSQPVRIGRGSVELRLDVRDKQVSRVHGRLEMRGNQLIYVDMSTHGTNINEIYVHQNEYPIHDGDRLQISQHTIVILNK